MLDVIEMKIHFKQIVDLAQRKCDCSKRIWFWGGFGALTHQYGKWRKMEL